jgi:hypothetical protein
LSAPLAHRLELLFCPQTVSLAHRLRNAAAAGLQRDHWVVHAPLSAQTQPQTIALFYYPCGNQEMPALSWALGGAHDERSVTSSSAKIKCTCTAVCLCVRRINSPGAMPKERHPIRVGPRLVLVLVVLVGTWRLGLSCMGPRRHPFLCWLMGVFVKPSPPTFPSMDETPVNGGRDTIPGTWQALSCWFQLGLIAK